MSEMVNLNKREKLFLTCTTIAVISYAVGVVTIGNPTAIPPFKTVAIFVISMSIAFVGIIGMIRYGEQNAEEFGG